ncbi:MAG TPA: undecaprenyldiphospho-muramoylpentapeptide beta-N-acetylglucosaminyltransferase [Bacteroidota bacterium]|nr:undecaprenyldiphospho-muramoylpentapeptide beta-N-acetylglucosaminyltransferase [Bacteroidota bacterium]
MSNKHPNIVMAGGGTGGHLYPALAIADEIRKQLPDADFLFVGTKGRIEARVVPERGYRFATIWISGLHRGLSLSNLLFPFKVVVSLVQSFFLIRQFRPDAIVGTGGYVCGPILYVGRLMNIPTFIHESNSYPGVTTRLLAARATRVFTAFEATERWLGKNARVELVGTPTRNSFEDVSKNAATTFFGLDPRKQTVLVFGGSLGATSVNRALTDIAPALAAENIQFIWQTGERDFESVMEKVGSRKVGWTGKYIDRMDYAYAASDVVVSRSGATTIAELTRIGKAAILVPYPFAAADHQTVNARSMEERSAAILIPDSRVGESLEAAIRGLLADPGKRQSMERAAKAMGRPNAGRVIATKILGIVEMKSHEKGI